MARKLITINLTSKNTLLGAGVCMFFFKRKGLRKALDVCQNKLMEQGIGSELTSWQYDALINAPLFHDIDSRFKSQGLSQWGGLAWFCAQTTGNVTETLRSGREINTEINDLAGKTAAIAFLLGRSIPGLKLTQMDMEAISKACEVATEWLEVTRPDGAGEFAESLGIV